MEALLGRLAIHYGFLTHDQLAHATRLQARLGDGRRLGQLLVELGYMTLEQLEELLTYQREYLESQPRPGADLDSRALPPRRPAAPAAGDAPGGVVHGAAAIRKVRRARRAAAEGGAGADPRAEPAVDAAPEAGADAASAAPPGPDLRKAPAGEAPGSAGAQPAATGGPDLRKAPAAATDGPPPGAAAAPTGAEAAPSPAAARPRADDDEEDAEEIPWITPSQARAAASADLFLETCLREAVELGASDVHAHAGMPLRLRLNGRLAQYGEHAMDRKALERCLRGLLSPEAATALDAAGHVEFVHTLPGGERYRASVYRQLHGLDAVFRPIPARPPTLSDLGLPAHLARLTNYDRGLVLVAGPGGCGKSSTLAALVNIINEERAVHVVCVEDPIEYRHQSKRALVNQRQVGLHTGSFARALKAALREDPDVIVIGELRDRETIGLALTAAETGHLVLATLHTADAINTIHRLENVFPPDQQAQIRATLADSLRAIVTQRLVRTTEGERRAIAYGVLMVTPAVGNLIRDGRTVQLPSVLQTGQAAGSHLLDDSLAHLLRVGRISRDEARRHATDPARFDATEAA